MAVSAYGRRRRLSLVVAVVATFLVIVGSPVLAYADPGTDLDGASTQSLREKLEAAARGFYYDAQAVLNASEQRQTEITQKLQVSQSWLWPGLTDQVGTVAAARYKGSPIGLLSGLITGRGQPAGSARRAPPWASTWSGATTPTYATYREIRRRGRDASRGCSTAELADPDQAASPHLDAQKRDAEKALAPVGGMVTAGYGGPCPAGPTGAPQRRRQLPAREVARSTTRPAPAAASRLGCTTRFTEARLAGFTRYVACWPQWHVGRASRVTGL